MQRCYLQRFKDGRLRHTYLTEDEAVNSVVDHPGSRFDYSRPFRCTVCSMWHVEFLKQHDLGKRGAGYDLEPTVPRVA